MRKNISKTRIVRLCLIFFILLYSVVTFENAFSHRGWKRDCVVMTYNRNDKSITLKFLFYDYCFAYDELAYLKWCEFSYSEDGENYTRLFNAAARVKKSTDRASIHMHNKKSGENIQFINSNKLVKSTTWPDGKDLDIEMKTRYRNFKFDKGEMLCNIANMTLKWDLSTSNKRVKFIKMTGLWISYNETLVNNIQSVFRLDHAKSDSKTIKDSPPGLKTEISNNVKVIRETDAISIKGAEPGENIKVYTVSGAEVKSVVANDDVLNIKLTKKKIYFVKAGHKQATK